MAKIIIYYSLFVTLIFGAYLAVYKTIQYRISYLEKTYYLEKATEYFHYKDFNEVHELLNPIKNKPSELVKSKRSFYSQKELEKELEEKPVKKVTPISKPNQLPIKNIALVKIDTSIEPKKIVQKTQIDTVTIRQLRSKIKITKSQ